MPLGQLTQVLRDINQESDPRLLVGPQTVDDAGVVLLGPAEGVPGGGVALVQTVDFFPPVIDDPYLYGAVAAANSLSDIYAMGGRALSALNLAGFPKGFREDWIREIFRGGFEKVRESGAVVAGGHTVETPEPMFGFAVTGLVDPAQVTANAGARVGDVLYLTKRLGMGSITTAGKLRKVGDDVVRAAALQMATLNRAAAEAMQVVGAHACTDVTGFGLVGHGRNIALASNVTLRLRTGDLPLFPGALDLARKGILSGGTARGKMALGQVVSVAAGADPAIVNIAFDAETSGGLLIVVAPEKAAALERELAARDVPVHAVGEVVPHSGRWIELHV
ncbi:MAG: selenide, water dikinase SelD [Planctomycetota bacterium]